jgi:hypothetical protein
VSLCKEGVPSSIEEGSKETQGRSWSQHCCCHTIMTAATDSCCCRGCLIVKAPAHQDLTMAATYASCKARRILNSRDSIRCKLHSAAQIWWTSCMSDTTTAPHVVSFIAQGRHINTAQQG